MTDLSKLRTCAEAVNLSGLYEWNGKIYGRHPWYLLWFPFLYDPENNDAQAMELVYTLKINLSFNYRHNQLKGWRVEGFLDLPWLVPSVIRWSAEKPNLAIVNCASALYTDTLFYKQRKKLENESNNSSKAS